jgi:TusA-related sulfurtransferase
MQIDLTGWRCPMLAIKAKKAIRSNIAAGAVTILVNDPKAKADLEAMARSMGWAMRYVGGQMVPNGVKEYEFVLV